MSRVLLPQLQTLLCNLSKDKPIFQEKDLEEFLRLGVQSVRTVLKTDMDPVIHYPDLVIEYAFASALMSKSLIEKGREMSITDNGITYESINVSNHLMHVAQMAFDNWHRKVHLLRA